MIIPKLYLNVSPQTVDDGGLVYARNMKLDDDGLLSSDYGFANIEALSNKNIVGTIVGLDNCVYFFEHNLQNGTDNIIEYNEVTKTINVIQANWHYEGQDTTIVGYVSTNISGEKILTIGEYKESGSRIPLKHINLSYCSTTDNESIYTQAPEVPIGNISLYDTYAKTIPNGVYVFFIRYKIRDGVYTNWFLCSNPIFSGTSEKINTIQGGVQYINLHKDSAKSFILNVSFINEVAKNNYSEFQLGFVITHDNASDARSWKSFSMNTNKVWFDYENVEEINIDDIMQDTYELYNVGNVCNFRNKLYISNYTESNLNPTDVTDIVNSIRLDVTHSGNNDIDYKSISFNGIQLSYDYAEGYYPIQASNLNRSLYNLKLSKYVKVSTDTNEGVATFSLRWKSNTSSEFDIMVIWNLKNKLLGGAIFGEDYQPTFGDGTLGLTKLGAINYGGANNYITIFDDGMFWNHPFNKNGMTAAYGSMRAEEVQSGATGSEDGVYMHNSSKLWTLSSGTVIYESTSNHTPTGTLTSDIKAFTASNAGFTDTQRQVIDKNIKSEIEAQTTCRLCYIELVSGTKTYKINYSAEFDNDYFAGKDSDGSYLGEIISDPNFVNIPEIETINTNAISETILSYIESNVVGVNDSGIPIVNLDGTLIPVNTVNVVIKKFEFDVDVSDVVSDWDNFAKDYSVNMTTTTYNVVGLLSCKTGIVKQLSNIEDYPQSNTLLPKSTYQPYIHLIDKHGVITNGFKYETTISTRNFSIYDDSLYYLTYWINLSQNINLQDYVGFFVSLVNVGDIILEGFKYEKRDGLHILHCLELDSMLYTIHNNITIIDDSVRENIITAKAKYNSSNVINPELAFGNCGFISWEVEGDEDYTYDKLFIKIPRESVNKPKSLIKCTPYIPLTNTNNAVIVTDGNYQGYRCIVRKPELNLSSDCYVAGTDVYNIERNDLFTIEEYNSAIQVQESVPRIIRSPYNLNYLTIGEELNDTIFTIGQGNPKIRQIGKVIQSLNLSSVYELKPMYKDFENKYFRPFTEYAKTKFDNTIRVSNVLSDETFNNSVFKFFPTDYYNLPTDRGPIVYLFSIGNNIYAHTKGSLYKFDGTQAITATDKDITLKESDPFDKGITQVFDSQYGYAGLQDRYAGCVTFDNYIFYDATNNHIFAYTGNGQLSLIDSTIYKCLNTFKPKHCKTLHDVDNYRVLFYFTDLTQHNNSCFTISYNYKIKSFISIHDINLAKTFETKLGCYSYLNNQVCKLFDRTSVDIPTDYVVSDEENTLYNIYGNATQLSTLLTYTDSNNKLIPFAISVVCKPTEYQIASLDNVNILANIQTNIFEQEGNKLILKYLKRKNNVYLNPITAVNVETDLCVSNSVTHTINDRERPNTLNSYKGFKYDKGIWSCNYFRNVLDSSNDFEYPSSDREIRNDQNTLVYGRWFVCNIQFVHDKSVKVENVNINDKIY